MTLSPAITLETRAEKLWPDNPRNQTEWIRAVGVVRSTKRGWDLDKPVPLLDDVRRVPRVLGDR